MSRYLVLVLLNIPLVIAGMLEALVDFKLKKISRKSLAMQLTIWSAIIIGLASAYPVYQFLFSKRLTISEPLSLFDVVQITLIIFILFIANRSRIRVEHLEQRIKMLHQELSITLSANTASNSLQSKKSEDKE